MLKPQRVLYKGRVTR